MNWIQLVKQEAENYGVSLTDAEADYVLWEETGFPDFFKLPNDHPTVEEACRRQLRTFFSSVQDERK